MPKRKIIPEGKEVSKRFIRSYEELRYRGTVKNKYDFFETLGIKKSANITLKKIEEGLTEPTVSNILLLHKKYNVSIEWILLGTGDFKCKPN